MASRYPTTPTVDYCFNPIHVVDEDKDIIVPCGKCDGCRLHQANEWSMRCGMEIEGSPATIFGSLSYTNKYLPKLRPLRFYGSSPADTSYSCWISDNSINIRYNGTYDVPREDNIVISYPYQSQFVKSWNNEVVPVIAYSSKRDIQLWLKLLRRFLDDEIHYKEKRVLEKGYFRYFVISEYGPYTFRPHYHFLIFCQSNEIAQALLDGALYSCWKMCLPERFFPYCHLCDSGARGYVTQYLTSFASLPRVYREVKEVRPFRLSSKSPSIGYIEQNKAKIFEDVSRGIINYIRPVPRLESASVLEYPSNFCSTLFPKCHGFATLSDRRRSIVYGYLYRAVRKFGESYTLLSKRLREVLYAQDYLATSACYRYCREIAGSPEHYMYVLDMYYYKLDMSHLKRFYESQQECDFRFNPYKIFEYYPNIEQFLMSTDLNKHKALRFLFDSVSLELSVFLNNHERYLEIKKKLYADNEVYRNEVSDICENMVKVSKFNEMTGNSPT